MSRITVARTVAVIGVALAVVGVLVVAAVGGGGAPATAPSSAPATATTAPRTLTATEAGQSFLAGYVDRDGRVVRRDQGGDTVSEGQAYAMLVAVALGDRDTFARVWSWTQRHLMRPDGTLSWRWHRGKVVDASSASDADLDAARALVVAGRRFADPTLTDAGRRLGTAILDVETVTTSVGRILVAGNWATTEPYAYNPSYASPAAVDVLAKDSGDRRWTELAAGSQAITRRVLTDAGLPADWAQVHGDGRVEPTSGAAGRGAEGVRYSYDAARLPLRYAESCHPEDVVLAAQLAGALARSPGGPAARDLTGQPLTSDQSVVAITAQAAVFAAAGDTTGANAQLIAADHQQQLGPTYYGGAWNALGRMLLTDPALGGCPPLRR